MGGLFRESFRLESEDARSADQFHAHPTRSQARSKHPTRAFTSSKELSRTRKRTDIVLYFAVFDCGS